jgi:RNA polymerase-binding transcription factor DksA
MTVGSERVELTDISRRLEEDYERHTRLLSSLITQVVEAGDEQFIVEKVIAGSRKALADIARATRAIAEGRYGVCGGCAGQIPTERLRAIPHTAYCASCVEHPG